MTSATQDEKQASESMPFVQQLAFCTTRLECNLISGQMGHGTGFFYKFAFGDDYWFPAIITNRHVIKPATHVVFQVTRAGGDGNPVIGEVVTFDLPDPTAHWVPHPDSDVDLCALPVGTLLNQALRDGNRVFFNKLDKDSILSSSAALTALEEVVMIGYPTGLWDSANNMPIFRKGITATAPRFDYKGRKEFMIDAACFPGSSGSPVFLWGSGIIEDRNTILTGGIRTALLGVLRAGPVWKAKGKIEVANLPTQTEPVAKTDIPINLGYVIKAETLLDFEPAFKARRQLVRAPGCGDSH